MNNRTYSKFGIGFFIEFRRVLALARAERNPDKSIGIDLNPVISDHGILNGRVVEQKNLTINGKLRETWGRKAKGS